MVIIFQIFFLTSLVPISSAQVDKTQDKNLLEGGKEFYKSGNYEEAIEAFSKVIRKSVDKAETLEAYVWLGYTYFTIEKPDEARINIEKGVELSPELELYEKDFGLEFVKFFKITKTEIVGVVFIETVPSGATVFIDNSLAGVTPLKRELLYQKYFMKVVKWGYSPNDQKFEVKRNEANYIKVDLSKGKNWKSFVQSAAIMVVFSFLIGSL